MKSATVDRELDLLCAICRVAIRTGDLHIAKNPMADVRRPRYFNERDRRQKSGEEARLDDRLRRIRVIGFLAGLAVDTKNGISRIEAYVTEDSKCGVLRAAWCLSVPRKHENSNEQRGYRTFICPSFPTTTTSTPVRAGRQW